MTREAPLGASAHVAWRFFGELVASVPPGVRRALTVRPRGLGQAAQQALLAIAVLLFVAKSATTIGLHSYLYGFDFRGAIWHSGRDVLAGRSPYPAPDAHAILVKGSVAFYPAAIIVAASPLALLPVTAATVVWNLLMTACTAAALAIVGVRDRRIYAVVFFSLPFTGSLMLGQIDGLLALGSALAWRYRDRARIAGAAVAALIATKVFLWPLAVWLLATRRWRAALLAGAGAAALTIAAWAVIGFAGLRDYPRLLAAASKAFEIRGYSFVATGLRAGFSVNEARSLALFATGVLLLAMYALSRSGLTDDRAFAAAVAAGIFSSPIVWMHSIVIFFVAFAVVRPRYSPLWLIPLAFWFSQTEPPSLFQFIAGQSLAVVLITVALLSARLSQVEITRARRLIGVARRV